MSRIFRATNLFVYLLEDKGELADSRTFARPPGFGETTGGPTSSPRKDITGLVPGGARARPRAGGGDRGGNQAENEPRGPETSPEGGGFSMTATGQDRMTADRRSS